MDINRIKGIILKAKGETEQYDKNTLQRLGEKRELTVVISVVGGKTYRYEKNYSFAYHIYSNVLEITQETMATMSFRYIAAEQITDILFEY